MDNVWKINPNVNDALSWLNYEPAWGRPAPPRSIYVSKKKKNARKAKRKARKRNR